MMETKIIINALRECKKLYTVMLDVSATMIADRLEELEKRNDVLHEDNSRLLDRIADYECRIVELKKQLSEKQPEWISVEERLPEKKDMVLAFAMDKDHRFAFLSDDENWYNSNGFLELNITHWMPLPEPPKPKEPTFKDVFLKAFPKAAISKNGIPKSCIEGIFPWGKRHDCDGICCNRCWNQPYFEEEGEADA